MGDLSSLVFDQKLIASELGQSENYWSINESQKK